MKPSRIAFAAFAAIVFLLAIYAISPNKGTPEENILVKAFDTIFDEINIFRGPGPKSEHIQEYSFFLSNADLNFFSEASKISGEAGFKTEYASDYRWVDLESNGERYRVRMALFGDGVWHFIGEKKSFKIRNENSVLFNGIERLNFILPDERVFIGPIYAQFIAQELGLPAPHYEIALANFNGMPQGLYLVEENWDESFLERNRMPGTVVLQRSENWMKDHAGNGFDYDFDSGLTFEMAHVTPFDLEISNLRSPDSDLNRQIMFRVQQMLTVVKENDQSRIGEFFDLNKMARVLAWSAILERSHDFCGDNLRLFYDTTTGKFWVVPRSEGAVEPLPTDITEVESYLVACATLKEPILQYLSKNIPLRCNRNTLLSQLLIDRQKLIDYHTLLEEKYTTALMSDTTGNMRSSKVAYYIQRSKNNLLNNLDVLEGLLKLEESQCS